MIAHCSVLKASGCDSASNQKKEEEIEFKKSEFIVQYKGYVFFVKLLFQLWVPTSQIEIYFFL